MNCELIQGDALKELVKIPNDSVDLCLTDPPYGLEFMGKEWDKFKEEEYWWWNYWYWNTIWKK